jgi:hypothetical protein
MILVTGAGKFIWRTAGPPGISLYAKAKGLRDNPKKLPNKPLRGIDKLLSALYCNFIFFLLI